MVFSITKAINFNGFKKPQSVWWRDPNDQTKSNSALSKDLHWIPVKQRIYFKILLTTNKILHDLNTLITCRVGVGVTSGVSHNYKLHGIEVGRIRTFLILPIPFTTPWKLDCRNRKHKLKNQPITRPGIEHLIGLFFRFCFRFRQSSFHWIISDRVISRMGVLAPSI